MNSLFQEEIEELLVNGNLRKSKKDKIPRGDQECLLLYLD